MIRLTRRKLLALGLGTGAACLLHGANKNAAGVSRTSRTLGAETTITVHGVPPVQAERAIAAAFQELETIEETLSLYRPTSQLARLNRQRSLRNADLRLLEVLADARRTAELTDGAFDVTVQPLWELHAAACKAQRAPSAAEIEAAQRCVDWQAVHVSHNDVELRAPVRSVTFNGIAQGYAADRVVSVLREHGIRHALVNTGELHGLGRKSNGHAWQVGIQHPRHADAFVSVANLEDRALATSGDYATAFDREFSKNHIFDPRTGASPTELASVSVVAPTAMQADALSTAAMVLGPNRAIELFQRLDGVDMLCVLKDGTVVRTPGFPALDVA